jgi:[ribosomal protein S18]-alanine N-acetyltransferase
MIGFIINLFARTPPSISDARPSDAADLAALHGACFNRGWSEDEFEQLLLDRAVMVHRVMIGRRLVGFVVSRIIAGEAEILSIAIAASWRGKGLAKQLLNLHLGRLAGRGTRTVFLEVDESNAPANRLYRRFGFRTVGRREGYYPDQIGRHGDEFPGPGRSTAALVLRCDLP